MHRPYGTANQQYVTNICQQCQHTENDEQPSSTGYLHTPLYNLSLEVKQSLGKLLESFKS